MEVKAYTLSSEIHERTPSNVSEQMPLLTLKPDVKAQLSQLPIFFKSQNGGDFD
jgi:hypothetical protein